MGNAPAKGATLQVYAISDLHTDEEANWHFIDGLTPPTKAYEMAIVGLGWVGSGRLID
jgi:hypothetical protein